MRIPINQIVLSSAARGAGTVYSNVHNGNSFEYAMVAIFITAKSGAPSLDVSLQMSPVNPNLDNTQWFTVYREEQIVDANLTGSGPWHFLGQPQPGFIGWLRVICTVGGTSTPILTYSVNLICK